MYERLRIRIHAGQLDVVSGDTPGSNFQLLFPCYSDKTFGCVLEVFSDEHC